MARHRTRQAIGTNRTSAIWRLVVAVILVATAVAAVPVIGTIALVYFVIMLLVMFFLDRKPGNQGLIMGLLRGIPMWYLALFKYAFLGREFPGFIPSRA